MNYKITVCPEENLDNAYDWYISKWNDEYSSWSVIEEGSSYTVYDAFEDAMVKYKILIRD